MSFTSTTSSRFEMDQSGETRVPISPSESSTSLSQCLTFHLSTSHSNYECYKITRDEYNDDVLAMDYLGYDSSESDSSDDSPRHYLGRYHEKAMSGKGQHPRARFRLRGVPEHAQLLLDGITGILKGRHGVLQSPFSYLSL